MPARDLTLSSYNLSPFVVTRFRTGLEPAYTTEWFTLSRRRGSNPRTFCLGSRLSTNWYTSTWRKLPGHFRVCHASILCAESGLNWQSPILSRTEISLRILLLRQLKATREIVAPIARVLLYYPPPRSYQGDFTICPPTHIFCTPRGTQTPTHNIRSVACYSVTPSGHKKQSLRRCWWRKSPSRTAVTWCPLHTIPSTTLFLYFTQF